MTGITGPAALTLPGAFSDLHLDTAHVTESVHYRASTSGQIAEADLLIGETRDHGTVRLHSDDPLYYDVLAEKAMRCALFLRESGRAA
jgi:hypothetical protein